VAWLEGSGVDLADGVACDERLATSLPDVVAAGDVASFPSPLDGERLRVEHWTNAVEQADAAVGRLLDGPTVKPFDSVPYFWSDQHGVKLQFAGRYRPGDTIRVVEGDPRARRAVVLYERAGRLTGAFCFQRPPALIKYRRLIGEGASFEGTLRDLENTAK
jgi:3-phenylpropionate/trans-cinnamate dioxygenase ferredoxin reductase component